MINNSVHKPIPTIHLTDFCNQNCSFCIAAESMPHARKKIIQMDDFVMLASSFSRMGSAGIKITGGETTLHPQFQELMKYALKKFILITLFTNGLFSEKTRDFLVQNGNRFYFVFNISTPGFQTDKAIRKRILGNIAAVAKVSGFSLSIVSSFLSDDVMRQLRNIPISLIRKSSVKLSLKNSIANDHNWMLIEDFPMIGKHVCRAIKSLNALAPPIRYDFEGWMRPCMFSDKDRKFLEKNNLGHIAQTTQCHSEGTHYYHVASDLQTFHCYPLSSMKRGKATKTNLSLLAKKYNEAENHLKREIILPICRKCPFFGFSKDKCSGPCLGFRVNAAK